MDARALFLIIVLVAAVLLLVTLINSRLKLHPFIALLIVAVLTGIVSGQSGSGIAESIMQGAGGVLGEVGITLALGAMLGRLLSDAGATDRIAELIVARGNMKTLPWLMTAAAFVIGIPMFFEVGLIILLPFIFGVAERIRRLVPRSKPYVLVITPAIAALSTLHGMVLPHPGPLTAAAGLNADLGKTILVGFICAVPTVILAGPIFARWLSRRMVVEPSRALIAQFTQTVPAQTAAAGMGVAASETAAERPRRPLKTAVLWALACVLLPIVLMLALSIAEVALPSNDPAMSWFRLFGNPIIAMLSAVLLAIAALSRDRTGEHVRRAIGESLKPIVGILMIIGAGGAFNQVLIDSGIGGAMVQAAQQWQMNLLIMGWLVALTLSTATGSATVGIVSATGIMAQLMPAGADGWLPALMVVAIGAGSLGLNYVNHAGFWLVKESFGMSIGQATRLHTVVQTLVSVLGLAMVLLLSLVL